MSATIPTKRKTRRRTSTAAGAPARRAAVVAEVFGKYRSVLGSSRSFATAKRAEARREDRRR